MFDYKEFAKRAETIVERTARLGLEKAKSSDHEFTRWLLIWASEVAGEMVGEVQGDNEITEVGDVLWGITALCLLLKIPTSEVFAPNHCEFELSGNLQYDALLEALLLLDYCKKVCRDGLELRPIDRNQIRIYLTKIFQCLNDYYAVDLALEAVDQKLQKRYPNGYTPEASVNRLE
jgi:NTP pyrophosphatase (non-canonical NTP hydrolase)